MAKASKLEEYWRQNNVENLLKDVTHVLAQRMPSDPALAIVQHLQKKFPKSFKASPETRADTDAVSKLTTDTLRSRMTASPRSDVNNESISDTGRTRRTSNQSQGSGTALVPSGRSAFTNLLNANTSSSSEAPEINIRDLVFANRISQHVVKLAKNIRSDHEILEEELLRPTKLYTRTTQASAYSTSENLQEVQTHEEPSVQQLIKYKQHIRTQIDRRRHREKLADLAKQAYDKDDVLMSGLAMQSDESLSQQRMDGDPTLSRVSAETTSAKAGHKPAAKSKAEEDVLNDENIFHPRKQRMRERHKNKPGTSRTHGPYSHRQSLVYLSSGERRGTVQGCICKVCGNVMTIDDLERYTQPDTVEPIANSVRSSRASVDDWFQSSGDASDSKSMILWTPDDITPPPNGRNLIQQNLFRPIANDGMTDVEQRPPSVPFISADNKSSTQRPTTTRLSESDTFARTASPYIRRPSLPRKTPSPVVKIQLPDRADRQSPKATTHSPSPRPVAASPLAATLDRNAERRSSDWGVRELSLEESDKN